MGGLGGEAAGGEKKRGENVGWEAAGKGGQRGIILERKMG